MNKDRRNAIRALSEQIENIKNDIESIQGDEQEYFDNMPENFQMGDKGEAASNAIAALGYALDSCNEAIEQLEGAAE